LLIEKQPPSLEEMAQRLSRRVAVIGSRPVAETISDPHAACRKCRARRERSLKHCHMEAEPKPRRPSPRESGAYVPELAARLDNDLNLTDGARRCARKLAEYIYRKNREGREAKITVTYLMKALGRCRRTVQRYLRQLEREGYIDVYVLPSERTRMCFGLLVRLLNPLLPRHRRYKWPTKAINSGATQESQIQKQGLERRTIRRSLWAFICADGVFRSYMKTLPPMPPLPLSL
jgi:hypothetical protein